MRNLFLTFFICLALLMTACANANERSTTNESLEAIPSETVTSDEVASEATSNEATSDEATSDEVTSLDPTSTTVPNATLSSQEAEEGAIAISPTDTPLATEIALSPTPTNTQGATETASPTSSPLATATPSPSTTPIPTETPRVHRTPLPFLTPMSTPNANGEVVHIVQKGDTVLGIAIQYGVIDNQIIAYNNLGEKAEIRIGDEIRIPMGMMTQYYSKIGGRATSTPMPTVVNETRVILGPVSFDWQKLNNCGPTTTHVMLSYYNIDRPQLTIANVLKPNPDDKNVSPSEIANYVRSLGMGVFVGVNGDIPLIERLLGAGYPVMVEQWMHYEEGVGHYRAVRGYDREQQKILQEDTFLGPDIWRSYEDFNYDWAYFNNLYLVFYRPEQEQHVAALIGTDWNHTVMWERALATFSQQEGAFAVYGKAEALHQLGRDAEAAPVYEQAIAMGLPELYFWYNFGYLETLNNLGQYQKMLNFSLPILEAMEVSEDIRYQRAVAFNALGLREKALNELQLAIQDNPHYEAAYVMLDELGVTQSAPSSTDITEEPASETESTSGG